MGSTRYWLIRHGKTEANRDKLILSTFLYLSVGVFLSLSVLAYGPFSLPIHDNNVQINGGGWWYSNSCVATTEHSGFDFDGENGDDSSDGDTEGDGGITEVYAAASGIVEEIDNSCFDETSGWGCYVKILHDTNNDGVYDYRSMYNHLYNGSINVSASDTVTTDTHIAFVGDSGASEGAHLDFRIEPYDETTCDSTIWGGCWIDPYNFYNAVSNPQPTCCDLPNGCPAERTVAGRTDTFDCSLADDSDYLWATCDPIFLEDATPGMAAEGWNADFSSYVYEAYQRNGGEDVLGDAFIDGASGTEYLHEWYDVYIQNFRISETSDEYAIITTDSLLETSNANPASAIRTGFWGYYGSGTIPVTDENGDTTYEYGPSVLGAPLGDEMDTTSDKSFGYDPVCDKNEDNTNDQSERENCITLYCDTSHDYTSMQRFENGYLCYADPTTYYFDLSGTLAASFYDDETVTSTTTSETDTDGDGTPDSDDDDIDGDGLSNTDETMWGFDSSDEDTDDDGLSDGDEITYGTGAQESDTDSDGLSDGDEVHIYGTDPLDDDTDNDGLLDIKDIALGDFSSQKLTNSYGDDLDWFGYSVTLENDFAVVGATQGGEAWRSGLASVFQSDGTLWSQSNEFDPYTTAEETYADHMSDFGQSVSISENYIAIGAPGDWDDSGETTGAVYLYQYNGAGWLLHTELHTPEGMTSWNEDSFGYAVSLDNDVLAVGAGGYNSYDGAVYIYRRDDATSTWNFVTQLTPTGTPNSRYFGRAVSVSDDRLLIGESCYPDVSTCSGTAFIYEWDGSDWILKQELTPSDLEDHDHFGYSVSLDGDTAVIGAYSSNSDNLHPGSAYVYRWDGTEWNEQELTASDGAANDRFGQSVAVEGNALIVGAPNDDDGGDLSGSAYIYYWSGTEWQEAEKLTASDGAAEDYFGWSVAINGGTAIVGSYNDDAKGTDSGSVYVFDITSLVTDTDGDGLSDDAEENTYGTSPNNPDTDGDGLDDDDELSLSTNPIGSDSDFDGLSDGDEVHLYSTDPLDDDTDDDLLSDASEVEIYGTNPSSTDTDGDSISDEFEVTHGMDALSSDTDNDGLNDDDEILIGTGPNETDSDNDTLSDGDEVNIYNTNPLDADTDDDDLQDGWEVNGYDADGDGIIDVDLPSYDADPLKKDLFVEVDWMQSTSFRGHNHMLKTTAAAQVVNTFAAMSTISNPDGTTGVAVHFDTGTYGGGTQISHDDDLSPVWVEFSTLKSANFNSNRNGIFKYLVMAHEYNGACTNNGISHNAAEDIVIAMGCTATQVGTVNEQSSAITRQLRNAVVDW